MASYTVILTGQDANAGDWTEEIDHLRQRLGDTESLLKEIVDQVILPALARNYHASGLKVRGGVLFEGITKRGARGNTIRIQGPLVTVAVDYGAIPYAKAQIEGSPEHAIRARKKKALRFEVGGQVVFARRVQHPGTEAHAIYYLTEADMNQARALVEKRLTEAS